MQASGYSGGEVTQMPFSPHYLFTPEWPPLSPDLPLEMSPLPDCKAYTMRIPLPMEPPSPIAPPGPIRTNFPPKPHGAKVAIPRQPVKTDEHRRKRSKWACVTCRRKKMKCSGDNPVCDQCQVANGECVYEDAKRLRDQRALSELSDKVRRYEGLLRDIERKVDGDTRHRIQDALNVSGLYFLLCAYFQHIDREKAEQV